MILLGVGVIVLGIAAGATGDRNTAVSRLCKMAASTVLVIAAIAATLGVDDPWPYAVLVVGALVLSWVGDLALSLEGRTAFVVGLVSFALAHIAYVAALLSFGVPSWGWFAIGAALMVVVGAGTLRWLAPHRPSELAGPVTGYVVIIGLMVATAFGTVGTTASALLPLAAMLFAASDILVARNQFVVRAPINRVVGLPMYFLAQALFVSTLV